MKKALFAVLSFGLNRAASEVLEKGLYISAGVGKDSSTDEVQTHLGISTWDKRFSKQHVPPQLKEFIVEDKDAVVDADYIDITEVI